ncbi:hypothetical protein Tco_1315510 [Tanacetum coccineum]
MYPTHTKIINSTIDDDQINSNIQFDSVKGNVNSGSVEKDTHVYDLCALETLARNAYDEAAKQQRFAQKVQQQNMTLTSQIEMYKERNRVLENITKDNNYLKEFLEADERAKRVQKQAESQLYRDRDIIRDLEKQRDKLSQEVKHFKQKNEELQQSHLILKRKMSENEDKYHDTILDLEEKLKKNVDLFLKIGNSLQAMFMLGPKPLSVYDQQLKHGLGYPNPYTLRQAISECPKLYVASRTGNIEIPLNVRDSEETLEDAFKSQQKMNEKMNDPIAVANKQNCWTIDYKQLNALYNDFVPQKESFVEQTCSSSSYIPFVKILETKTMPSELPLINELFNIKVGFEKLFLLIKQNSKRASMFYTSKEEIALNDFCRDQVKPLLNELLDYFDGFQNLFQRDIKEMKDAFEQNDVYLDEIERQNDLLKEQLLEASLKHDIELCVLLNHECVDKSLHDKLEHVKKKSLEIQEGLKARIKILEKDVQRCEKQSVDFELKLQHAKEKHKWDSSKNKNSKPLDFSWISRIQKLEDENVSLDFKVQSLIKERDNAKMEYKKLSDLIKKTRSQTQKEMDELIVHVFEKTYAYGVIRAENHNLLDTISELKARMKNGENGVRWQVRGTVHPRWQYEVAKNIRLELCRLKNPPYKFKWTETTVLVVEGSLETTTEGYMENYKNVSQDIRNQLDAEAEADQIIFTRIDNDIYSIVDACLNACEMWKAIEKLKQGESINAQDLETNLFWEFGKFTSRDGETLESYYSRFYKMMNELVRNQCDSQELKTVSYHKLYDILKQHQNKVNEIRAERLARTANPLALVDQQQPFYHPQNHHQHNPTHYTQNSSTRPQQAATRNRGKAIVNSLQPTYNQEPAMIDNSPRISRGTGYDNQRAVNVVWARENVDDTDDEHEDQELEAYYLYMAKIQEVTLDAAENSGPIFDTESLQKVQNDDDNYNVFANDKEHPEQPKSVNDRYPDGQGDTNITMISLIMSIIERRSWLG